jgi:hypothetical protein
LIRTASLIALLALAACQDKPADVAIDAGERPQAIPVAEQGKAWVDAINADLGADAPVGKDTRLTTASSDLNGDGRDEALVYVAGPGLCGSGGCNLYVLAEGGDNAWSVDSKMTVTRPPIYRLGTRTNGWADLAVTVSGGGLMRTVMKVPRGPNGYASNPTVPPATAIDPGNAQVLISEQAAGLPGAG